MRRTLLRLTLLALVGCGGNANTSAVGAVPAPAAQATLNLRITLAQTYAEPVASVAVTAASQQYGTSYQTTTVCGAPSCTVHATAPLNFVDVTVALLGADGATLDTGMLLTDMPPSGRRTMNVGFGVTPEVYNFSVEPATLVIGSPGTAKLSIVARDGQGTEIIGTTALPAPIAISGPSSGITLASPQVTAIGQNVAIGYDGSTIHHVHFTGATTSGATINGTTLFIAPSAHVNALGRGSGDAIAPTRRRILTLPSPPPMPPPIGGRIGQSTIRTTMDLGSSFPPIGDQGSSMACGPFSAVYAIRSYFAGLHLGWSFIGGSGPNGINTDQVFSPEFAFAALNGGQNVGLDPSDLVNFLQQYGAATWTQMPFAATNYGPAPNGTQYAEAASYPIYDIATIDNGDLTTLKGWLDAGYPVWWSVAIDDNFEYLGPFQTWTGGGNAEGSHAVVITGYNDANQTLTVRNSWGTSWGTSGVGYVSYTQWAAASILNAVLSDQPSP